MPTWRGNTYRFVITSASATANAVYANNGQQFTVTDTVSAGTVLFATGTGAPSPSGTLTLVSGAGNVTITFTSVTAPNTNWGTSTNWLTDGSGAGVPTSTGAGTDATFDNKSGNCTVNVVATCKNLTFNSGTGYTNTITMTNEIRVGAVSTANPSVTLSPGMFINGTGAIYTRANGTTTLTSNGKVWPNILFANAINASGTVSTVVLADNWTVGGLVLGIGSQNLTLSGAFTISVNGNLAFNNTSRLSGVAGALSTIRLIGTGTVSVSTTSPNIGVNLTIDAGANTVTFTDGIAYGGTTGGTSGFTFSYVSGTVTCVGIFAFGCVQSGPSYNVNLSGDSSPTATTTSSTGVNFDTLRLATTTPNLAQQMTVTGTLCAVNNLEILSFPVGTPTPNKYLFGLNGGTIYVNGNLTLNAYLLTTLTPPTFILQGTGTWTENLTLTSPSNAFGLFGNLIINTTGIITLGSYVGFRIGTMTYTNGTINYNGFGFRLNNATLSGFSTAGTVNYIMHTTTGGITAVGTRLTINDSTELSIGTLTFDGFTTNTGFYYLGTKGWTVNTFNFQQSVLNGANPLRITSGNIYRVTNSFIFLGRTRASATSNNAIRGEGGVATFILSPGATQEVWVEGAFNIDSSAGQTIWSRWGSLIAATNWRSYTIPSTVHETFVSS